MYGVKLHTMNLPAQEREQQMATETLDFDQTYDLGEVACAVEEFRKTGYRENLLKREQDRGVNSRETLKGLAVLRWSDGHGTVVQPVREESGCIWFVCASYCRSESDLVSEQWSAAVIPEPVNSVPHSFIVYRFGLAEMSFGKEYWVLSEDMYRGLYRFSFDAEGLYANWSLREDFSYMLEQAREAHGI